MCRKMQEIMQNSSWDATTLHAKGVEYIKMGRRCETNVTPSNCVQQAAQPSVFIIRMLVCYKPEGRGSYSQ
jgi:hypothetical protein